MAFRQTFSSCWLVPHAYLLKSRYAYSTTERGGQNIGSVSRPMLQILKLKAHNEQPSNGWPQRLPILRHGWLGPPQQKSEDRLLGSHPQQRRLLDSRREWEG